MNQEYQYPMFDDHGKVVCQICGKSYLVISPKHLTTHKIQYADYTKRYPDAPLSSDEFTAKSKYGKVKDLFSSDDNIEDAVGEEETYVEEDADFDELSLDEIIKTQLTEIRDPVQRDKAKIHDHLRIHFANVEKDYKLREISKMSKIQLFDYITDFCDPVLKIVFQFPNTFWHNNDVHIDPLKNDKLRKQGWKVLEINSRAPSIADIDKVIDSM
jgi:hypothetical protein